jgi:23S rRNA pseudouridine955/2504/2580 synthase
MTAQDPTKPAGDKPSVRMITVPADRAGQRLDNFLLGQLKGAPRSLVYKLVRSGQVRVNGGRAKAERKLEAGDEVRVPPVRLTEEETRPVRRRRSCAAWSRPSSSRTPACWP